MLAEIVEQKPRHAHRLLGHLVRPRAGMAAAARRTTAPVVNQLSITRRGSRGLRRARLLPLDRASALVCRASMPAGLELMPAGVAVLRQALLEATGSPGLTASEWALREGIVLSAIRKHDRADLSDDPRAIRRASVLSFCRRSSWREAHARKVAELAVQLFDALDRAPRPRADRSGAARARPASLHDIGEHVSRDSHDRHTAVPDRERRVAGVFAGRGALADLCSPVSHRGRPRETFPAWEALSAPDRSRCLGQLSLLRIADGLDVPTRSSSARSGPPSARVASSWWRRLGVTPS